MFQFHQQEADDLRRRAKKSPEILEELLRRGEPLLKSPVMVPATGIANWVMYFFCPDCSVRLIFDRSQPHRHVCPHCGKAFSGEPYDSAWWRLVNGENCSGARCLGMLYLLTGDEAYARRGIDIFSAYANYYRGYEVHGNIPHNKPGKLGAQTLDDANFIREAAMAYDLLEPAMTEGEKRHIQEGLLLPAAEFLMANRMEHQHNHELIISAAVGMIGLILGREDLIQFALYDDYGLYWQLEHGVTDSGVWFEGTFGYHFYSLEAFFQYERFAVHTEHSHIGHPLYRKMLMAAVTFAQPDFDFSKLNDTYDGHGTLSGKSLLYEFAYRQSGDTEYLRILHRMYQTKKRGGIDTFFWGVEKLPECEPAADTTACIHPEPGQPGLTVLRGNHDRYLLFKHDEFGGEHDHYDRLGISFLAYGKRIAADFGTTAYGAPLHFDYFKNTGTHNTVMIEEKNQAPGKARLVRYDEDEAFIYAEACIDWREPYQMPLIFTLPNWDEQAYRGIRMTRKIAWPREGDWFAECFIVEGLDGRKADWVMHIDGDPETGDRMCPLEGALSAERPLKHMKEIRYSDRPQQVVCSRFSADDVGVSLYSWIPDGTLYLGRVPDNPSVRDISQIVERKTGDTAVFLHLMEARRGAAGCAAVRMSCRDGEAVIEFDESTDNSTAHRRIVFPGIPKQ